MYTLVIRKYRPGEEMTLWHLFFETVRTININDYSEAHTEAWAPSYYGSLQWEERMRGINPFVALLNDVIVGYVDVQSNGYIDHFLQCKASGEGIGCALMKRIHQEVQAYNIHRLSAEVSITALPFFDKMGFEVIKQQKVEIRAQLIINYKLSKQL